MGMRSNEESKVAIVFEHTMDSRRGSGQEIAQVKLGSDLPRTAAQRVNIEMAVFVSS